MNAFYGKIRNTALMLQTVKYFEMRTNYWHMPKEISDWIYEAANTDLLMVLFIKILMLQRRLLITHWWDWNMD